MNKKPFRISPNCWPGHHDLNRMLASASEDDLRALRIFNSLGWPDREEIESMIRAQIWDDMVKMEREANEPQ